MCNLDPSVVAQLEVTVRQFLDQGQPFSAYNITVATRDREKIFLKHQQTEGYVHEIVYVQDAMAQGWNTPNSDPNMPDMWTRSVWDIDAGRVLSPGEQTPLKWFWLYHPVGFDTTQFKPFSDSQLKASWGVPSSPSPAVSVNPPQPLPVGCAITAVPIPAHPDGGGLAKDGTFSVDYRERLLVPTRFLAKAGINPGDELSVIVDETNRLVMLAADSTNFQGGSVKITTQRTEKWGDIRLSSKTLKPVGGDRYKIDTADENGTTVVKIMPA
jgi:bifunctional DNA-binding transcriptional regulator/antitoxin component of YhaV-PrlF toxin-antitoxin module